MIEQEYFCPLCEQHCVGDPDNCIGCMMKNDDPIEEIEALMNKHAEERGEPLPRKKVVHLETWDARQYLELRRLSKQHEED